MFPKFSDLNEHSRMTYGRDSGYLKTFCVLPYGSQVWKVQVKLSLCLAKHHAMKTYRGVEVKLHAFFTSALDGGGWSALRPGLFTPGERVPCTQTAVGRVDPRADLDAVEKRKIPSPSRESNPRISTVKSAASRYTD
jgi:hypothetical protein